MLPEGIKKTTLKKIVVVSEEERMADEFIAPTKYYIVNAFGDGVFFRTRDRATAQSLSDEVYGKGFYTVKQIIFAQAR